MGPRHPELGRLQVEPRPSASDRRPVADLVVVPRRKLHHRPISQGAAHDELVRQRPYQLGPRRQSAERSEQLLPQRSVSDLAYRTWQGKRTAPRRRLGSRRRPAAQSAIRRTPFRPQGQLCRQRRDFDTAAGRPGHAAEQSSTRAESGQSGRQASSGQLFLLDAENPGAARRLSYRLLRLFDRQPGCAAPDVRPGSRACAAQSGTLLRDRREEVRGLPAGGL